jgi:hypothetical protein
MVSAFHGLDFSIIWYYVEKLKAMLIFIAGAHGLRFPSQCPQISNTQWLLVPWKRVEVV